MDASMKCKKSQMEEGIMPLKSLHDGWSRETFQITSSVELFLRIMKMKNKFCNSHQYEMQKSRDGGGNNTYKIQTCRVEEGNVKYKQNTMFGVVHSYNEKETIFWMNKKVNSMKP